MFSKMWKSLFGKSSDKPQEIREPDNEIPGLIDQANREVTRLYKQGRYEEAIQLATKTVNLARQGLGETHPAFAASLQNLGGLYMSTGNYTAAAPFLKQAIETYRTTLGEQHPAFARGLNNLAGLYYSTGDYAAAIPLFKQAMEIKRAVLGEQHPEFAQGLNNLGGLLMLTGDYAAAIPLFKQAMEIRRAILGEQHPDFASSLNNLAGLYYSTGDYAAALPLFKQAMEVKRVMPGEQHPSFAVSLTNLANTYESMGDYAAAAPLLTQAMKIYRVALGEQHPSFAASLTNLAVMLYRMDEYAATEPLLRQALEIDRRVLGENHSSYATDLNNMAMLYESMGNYAAAEPLLRQAVEIRRTTLGEAHPDLATNLNNLAMLCVATARENEAMTLVQQAAAIDDKMIGQIFSLGSESQRTAYLKTLEVNFAAFLSLISQHLSHSPTATRAALELILRRKAVGAEALAAQRDAVLGGKYPGLEPKLRELTTLRMQIAQKTLAGPGPEGLSAHQQRLVGWNAQKERLEAELSPQVSEMNLEQKLRAADRQAVALALSEGTTLVEFVRFNICDFKAVPARGESHWRPARYLAFVLPAGEPDNVQMIDLGEAEPIDQMIATFRSAITGEGESRGGRGLGALPSEPGTSDGAALRAALFDPLLPAIGHRTRLLLAPDGDLTRLPFEVLPTRDGRRLIDDYQISYLGAGRDVLRFGAASSGQPTAALVAADPDFDLSAAADRNAANIAETTGRRSRDLERGLTTVARLPGTWAEGERIAAMLGVTPCLEKEALEARIKACRSPRILHLATHGFFLKDQPRDPNQEWRGLGAMGAQAEGGWGRMSGPGMENPLLRSGLLLAGFNTWFAGGELPAEAEDGILTAEDVSGLDLLATELVVLSACETGLGEVHVGEGVFGLRRAFVLAGAKTLVMSLWKVPDEQTRELMEDFYRRILRGEARAEALRQAQLAMKEKYTDPFYWGAFICQGDPGPLP